MNWKFLFPGTNKISDAMDNIQIRGFENNRRPSRDIFQGKMSIKVNNYNYPLLGGVGIVPFLYTQAGITFE